jgi:hypothetical protein
VSRASGAPPVFAPLETVLAIADPDNVKHWIVEDLVKALDGEIVVRCNNRQEVKVD